MKTILSFVFLCLVAGTVSAKFAHDGPTPEYKSKFLTTMEGIHADAWESIQPFLDSLDTYVNQSVTAWKTFADEHKSSKAGRMFWAGAKKNMTGEIDSMLMASHTKISDVLASYQAKMEETAASWKGKHAAYDIEGKIGELQTYADETLMGFKGYLGHSPKSRRSLRGFWESYASHKGSKGSKGSLFSHSYDYAAKKAEFEAKLAGYKADLESKYDDAKSDVKSKLSSYKSDHTAKYDGYKSDIKSKLSSYKSDHTAKLDGYKSDIKSKLSSYKSDHSAKTDIKSKISDFKASKPSFAGKLSHN